MLRDDALLAFERHATSKLRDVKDLLSIATLGFRGEALPSIASVSRLLLETRAAEETTGTRVEIAGGKMLRCEEVARGAGTTITVRDLFFNVPARKKFLRSEQTELAHIASLVTHYSLAHPDKTFRLSQRAGRTAARHAGGHAARARLPGVRQPGRWMTWWTWARERELRMPPPSVPPSEAIAEFRREPEEPSTKIFRLRGFVSRPQVQKGNRNSIFIFVNGRLIRDRLLLHAISSAYHNLMPAGVVPVRAAVSRLRLRRGGRERPSVEDRGALPPPVLRARFRARRDPRAADRIAAGAGVLAGCPARGRQPARAQLPYSEFQPDAGERAPREHPPERRSRSRPRRRRLDDSAPRIYAAARPRRPRPGSISWTRRPDAG